MVNIAKVGDSAIKFTFTDNDHYLFNGEIEVPLNSLLLILDESDFATFKKIDGDPFVSFLISNSNFASKEALETFYKDNMVGGGNSLTPEEAQEMIDESISGKADTTAVTESINAAVSGKQDTLSAGTNITISGNVISAEGKAIEAGRGIAIATGETADTVSFNLPISAGTGSNSIKCGENSNASGTNSFAIGSDGVKASATASFAGGSYSEAKQAFSMAFGRYSTTNNYGEVALGFFNKSNGGSSAAGNSSGNTLFSVGNGTTQNARHNAFEIRQNGDIYITSGGTDIKLQDNLGGGGGGGNNVIEVTQAEYDALVSAGTVDLTALYVITDAPSVDMSNYYTSAQTNSAITAAVSGKQDTLIAGDNITISGNVISASGGGSSVNVVQTTGTSTTDVMSQDAVTTQLSGYVTTDTEQIISGRKIFTYTSAGSTKSIEFKQTNDSSRVGFRIRNSAETNNELATFEFRPNTFTVDNVQHPLLYFGHYRNTNTANAGVPQTVIGFRQYDQKNAAAYHYLMPLPEKAKTPFSLTTTFKDYYAPIGFKNGSTMITADETGVVDLSSELDGLKLKKLTQQEYDALVTKDNSTVYIIVN